MKKKLNDYSVALLLGVVIFTMGCRKPKDKIETPVASIPEKVYVLNEGSFLNSNASVDVYDVTNKIMYNDLFGTTNGRTLGDVLQSMCLVNGKSYFVMNNSNRIEFAMAEYPLTSQGVIEGFNQPRYMVAANANKAFVSEHLDYGSLTGRIAVLDLTTNSIVSSIEVGLKPEAMLCMGNNLYVCLSGEDKVAIVDVSTNQVTGSITVGKGPNSIVKDADGKIWVMCRGEIAYDVNWNVDLMNSIPGVLVQLNPTTNTVENSFTFSSTTGEPGRLVSNGSGTELFYTYSNAVYQQNIYASNLPTTPFIDRNFYGLGIDPVSNIIYTGTYGFASNQKMIRYQLDGTPIDSMSVGVGPNGFVFSY